VRVSSEARTLVSRYSFPIFSQPNSTFIAWANALRQLFDEELIEKPEKFTPTFQATAGGTISSTAIGNNYKQISNNKVFFNVDFSVTWSVAGPEVKVIFPFKELSVLTNGGFGGTLYSSGGTVPTAILGYTPVGNNGLFIRRYDNSNFAVGTHAYYMTGFYFFE
jgi:hypothetical protein